MKDVISRLIDDSPRAILPDGETIATVKNPCLNEILEAVMVSGNKQFVAGGGVGHKEDGKLINALFYGVRPIAAEQNDRYEITEGVWHRGKIIYYKPVSTLDSFDSAMDYIKDREQALMSGTVGISESDVQL